jgi:curved DNA-binding protein CbpA
MVLRVKPIASPDEIRKAYRELSKKYHPDLNPGMKAASDEKMKELVAAYNVLNAKDKRKEYDAQPQFQYRKFAKGREKPSKGDFGKAPKKKKEGFLTKLLNTFKKDGAAKGGHDPKQADVHFMLGLSMAESDNFLDQAKAEFKRALEYDPKHMEAAYNLALTFYKNGEFDEARRGLNEVLALNAQDQYAKMLLKLLHDPDL